MLKMPNASHLTGTSRVIKNNIFSDVLEPRAGRSLSQMFFQPYESKEEYLFCLRRTLVPSLLLVNGVLLPIIIGATLISSIATSVLFFLTSFNSSYEYDPEQSYDMNIVHGILNSFTQLIFDVLISPLSVLVMLTRGISTGLQATKLYDFDAPATGTGHYAR